MKYVLDYAIGALGEAIDSDGHIDDKFAAMHSDVLEQFNEYWYKKGDKKTIYKWFLDSIPLNYAINDSQAYLSGYMMSHSYQLGNILYIVIADIDLANQAKKLLDKRSQYYRARLTPQNETVLSFSAINNPFQGLYGLAEEVPEPILEDIDE